MDLCENGYAKADSHWHKHSLTRTNTNMSNAAAAAAAAAPNVSLESVGNCENLTALSILQLINNLREEQCLIDIEVEVCEAM